METRGLKAVIYEWGFWNFLGVRLISLIFGLGSLYSLTSDPLYTSWGGLWAIQPMWFFYVQLGLGALTLIASRTSKLWLKVSILILTLIPLHALTWVSGLTFYQYATPSLEYQLFTQLLLVAPYTVVQIAYGYVILSKAIRGKRLN